MEDEHLCDKRKNSLLENGHEPTMLLQRPSAGVSQEVRHILTHIFRDIFTRDALHPETVRNLLVTKDSDDPYHESYVKRLEKVYNEWNKRMAESAMLEQHIMQAQARAMTANERNLQRSISSCDHYNSLGIPTSCAYFKSCIDTKLLQNHSLLTPADYSTDQPAVVPPPGPVDPTYTHETLSSQQHSKQSLLMTKETEITDSSGDIELSSFDSSGEPAGQERLSKSIINAKKRVSVGVWKKGLHTETRQLDRADLSMMESKIGYLRNPHHVAPLASGNKTLVHSSKVPPKEANMSRRQTRKILKETQVFIASPVEIVFTDYTFGQVYETILELKNISTVMRQCRAVPTSFSHFSIGLGQFPTDSGMVAPGMSCHFPVRFAPDSLRDYDGDITIYTQASCQLFVPVKGRRRPPSLTMPSEIDAGCCLVSGFLVTKFKIRNDGGPGRFCLMPRSVWPPTNFKLSTQTGAVKLPPFEIHPINIELAANKVIVVEIVFRPPVASIYRKEFSILCDNCQIQHFTVKGEGQLLKVSLDSVDEGESPPLPGEWFDFSAQHFIKMDDLNPFVYTEKTITVKNHTDVELPFLWIICKPEIHSDSVPALSTSQTAHHVMNDVECNAEIEHTQEVDCVFSICPLSGVLEPSKSTDFQILFAPPVVGKFHSVLRLVALQIPTPVLVSNTDDGVVEQIRLISSLDETSEIQASENDVPSYRDLTVIAIDVKGGCVQPDVVLHPYAVYVPGTHLISTTFNRLITMENHSFSILTFQWKPVHDEKKILEVNPPFGELDPGMAMDLELSITGAQPGHISHTLLCIVGSLQQPLHLLVDANIKGPEVSVNEPSINFGLVRLGDVVERQMNLNSLCQLSTRWTLIDKPSSSDEKNNMHFEAESVLTFSPSSGELHPFGCMGVVVQFRPKNTGSFETTAILRVELGNTVCVAVYAEVQEPLICLLECEVQLSEVYVGVPVPFVITIFNQTPLPTEFSWGAVEGRDMSDCVVQCSEHVRHVNGRERRTVEFSFCPFTAKYYSEVRVPCFIEGQDEPLFFNISCSAISLTVTYKTSVDGHIMCDDRTIDFGAGVALGTEVKRYLYICNQTAITTNFGVSMGTFAASDAAASASTSSLAKDDVVSDRWEISSSTCKLSKADVAGTKPNRTSPDVQIHFLDRNLGAAFVLRPPSGELLPFCVQKIEITAYSNMWGKYNDDIVCKVGDLNAVSIPVHMTVIGCPLNFQMTVANLNQPTILRFGSFIAGMPSVTRRMRVNNPSPFNIRVDWHVYNLIKDDDALLDFIVSYGRPFPLLDSSGQEVSTERDNSQLEYNSEVSCDHTTNQNTQDFTNSESKLITVHLRPHDGEKGFIPYSVTPKQLVIHPKSNATVNVMFTPPAVEDVIVEESYTSYALGYLSLYSEETSLQAAVVAGHVERLDAYNVEQLRIDCTAQMTPALLTVEEVDEDGMSYHTALSELLDGDKFQVLDETLQVRSLILTNNSLLPLRFHLCVQPPFIIVDLPTCDSGKAKSKSPQSDCITLKPRRNMLVKVALCMTSMMVNDRKDLPVTDGQPVGEGHDSCLGIKDHLEIVFSNGVKQNVALEAMVVMPQMMLSQKELNFGTCLVGQRRELQLTVSNRTGSHCRWTASIDNKSPTCAEDSFQIVPAGGDLEAYVSHTSNNKTVLAVYFTAKNTEAYDAIISFKGILGETPQLLHVEGEGSFDGKHKAQLNV